LTEEIFKHIPQWVTRFCINGKNYGGADDLTNDPRIIRLSKLLSLSGKRVLELGPLEGAHTLMLQRFGAGEIIAIEGRVQNYVKCCVIKNLFHMDKCTFLLGDFSYKGNFPWATLGRFDLAVCIGVLYHVDEPAYVIRQLSEIADNLYLWSQIADEKFPHGPVMTLHAYGESWRGRVHYEEHPTSPLSGFQQSEFWLFRDDLLKLVRDFGFVNVQVLDEGQRDLAEGVASKYCLLFASKG